MIPRTNPKRQRGEGEDDVLFPGAPRWRFGAVYGFFLLFLLFKFTAADEPAYQGSVRCLDCHTQPNALRQRDGTTDWVAMTEAQTWLTRDKHAHAFDVLKTDQSRTIGRRLDIDDVSQDQSCLSCHAGWLKGLPAPPRLELGVSCEACHGPSSLYDVQHTKPTWRIKSAEEKAELGMIEVRQPVLRAQQCLSCHLGNAEEGKLLTHAMYAAGHPPLGGFELATFSQAMPPHWRQLHEKADAVRGDPQIRRAIGYHEGDLPQVKSTIVGGIVLLRESARLNGAWQAMAADSGDWPDFAQYDCAACHHELERPSWRQARAKQPGKLMPAVWPSALVELAIRHVERDDAGAAQRFRRQIEAQLATRGDLSSTLDELLTELVRLPCERTAAVHVLHDVAELGGQPYLDLDSARQLGWAFRSTYLAIDNSHVDERPLLDPLAELSDLLQLDLPAILKHEIMDANGRQAMYRALSDYQPRLASACFVKLAETVGE